MQQFSVLGVRIDNATVGEAAAAVVQRISQFDGRPCCVYFVNAHTLNLAASDSAYRDILNRGDCVFGDGTGVRWAARLQGVRVAENLAGTDFVPSLLQTTGDRSRSYFLLGADASTVEAAAARAGQLFPAWKCVGRHHGFVADAAVDAAAVAEINAAKPDLLLVGMGNPLQEQWIDRHRDVLQVPVCMGVGGLFDFWAGNVSRAPKWLRRLGHEWVWRLFQEPFKKGGRYLIGNPLFLSRIVRERCRRST